MSFKASLLLFIILTIVFVLSTFTPFLFYIHIYILIFDGALLAGVSALFGDRELNHNLISNIVANFVPLIGFSFVFFKSSNKRQRIIFGILMMIFTFSFVSFSTDMSHDGDPYYLKPMIISFTSGLILILLTLLVHKFDKRKQRQL